MLTLDDGLYPFTGVTKSMGVSTTGWFVHTYICATGHERCFSQALDLLLRVSFEHFRAIFNLKIYLSTKE